MIQSEPVVIPDELVQAARQGTPSAFAELWQRCAPIVRESIARSSGTHGVEASEVAQEAALVLLSILSEPLSTQSDSTTPNSASFAEIYRRRLQRRIR